MSAAGAESAGGKNSYVYAGYARPLVDDDFDLVRRFLIADAYARFRRSRGDAVLFALGIESFGEAVETEATRRDVPPADLVDEYRVQLCKRFEDLGISCDWDRTVVTSRPEHRLRAQLMFLALLERDLVYRRDPPGESGAEGARWLIRGSRFAERCEQGLEELSSWTTEAVETQRLALGRVDGIEVKATLLGGGDLVVFTPYADSIADAAFVSVSPNHPEIDAIAAPSEIARRRSDPAGGGVVQVGLQAAVPGVDDLLPVVVTPLVDDRFGPTAALGMPGRDELDREIAARLQSSPRLPMRATSSKSKPKPAARYRLPDLAISRETAWGTPIPVVHCQDCGGVPLAVDEIAKRLRDEPNDPFAAAAPAERAEARARDCPRCGGPAEQDPAAIDWDLDGMWMWLWICIPPAERESSILSHPECERWLPAKQIVWNAGDGGHLLQQRLAGRILDELELVPLDVGEPFTGALVHGSVNGGEASGREDAERVEDLDELVRRAGGDVARFAILDAASPGKSTGLYSHSVRGAERLTRELRESAERRFSRSEPVPTEIDRSTRPRRRLAAWCGIAAERIAEHLERLEIHRATYDLALFLKRIQDFESRCAENGEIEPADDDALAVATLELVRLAEPFVPDTSTELEAVAEAA